MYEFGKILKINLTRREVKKDVFPKMLKKMYLGGRGINLRILYKNLNAKINPLSEENVLIVSPGLFVGLRPIIPSSCRVHISAKSPLTGIIGSSNAGGYFGSELKSAGIETIVIYGKSKKPVYIWIENGNAQILDASELWGMDTLQTGEMIKKELGDSKIKTMTIGPAGENLVKFACIMAGMHNAAGRTGLGAVMGSKNLKPIAVRGKNPVKIENKNLNEIKTTIRNLTKKILESPKYKCISTLGGSGSISWDNEMGILSTKNYDEPVFEKIKKIRGESFTKYIKKFESCFGCPVHCKATLTLKDSSFVLPTCPRPEEESIAALGPKCGNGNLESIIYMNNLCTLYGLDTMTTGSVLAFAMDCYEKGIISREETDDISLEWGNYESMIVMIRKIVFREGFGSVLGEGVKRACEIIGKGCEKYAYHVKGLEIACYDPRGLMATALGYAVSYRGGDFTSVYPNAEYSYDPETAKKFFGTKKAVDRFSTEGKALIVKRSSSVCAVLDCLGICKIPIFLLLSPDDFADLAKIISLVIQQKMDEGELLKIGERIINIERLFNVREGITKKDDKLPEKFVKEPLLKGPAKGNVVRLGPMLDEFYKIMGWDENGIPTNSKILKEVMESSNSFYQL
ncbi:MAG: aldehyde ferredoxin oxidoreductase family protein [Candidatus Methanofastidiosia archaeon]